MVTLQFHTDLEVMQMSHWLVLINEDPAVLVHMVLIGNHVELHIVDGCGITIMVFDVSIFIVYDVSLLLSKTYQFQGRSGKNWLYV